MRKNNYSPKRLQALLDKNGLTPARLSERTEIALPTIRAYLDGKREAISTRNMLLFAQVFEMPMADLIDYLSDMGNMDKK